MTSRRDLGDFGERVAAAHLEIVPFPTVETVGFSNPEAAGFIPQAMNDAIHRRPLAPVRVLAPHSACWVD